MNHVLGRGPDPSRKRGNFEGAPCLLSKFCDHSLRRCLFEHSKLQHPWVVVKNAADDVRAVWFVVWRITDDEKRSRFLYFYLTSQLFLFNCCLFYLSSCSCLCVRCSSTARRSAQTLHRIRKSPVAARTRFCVWLKTAATGKIRAEMCVLCVCCLWTSLQDKALVEKFCRKLIS